MPMRPEDIPRQKERLILADATQKFERLLPHFARERRDASRALAPERFKRFWKD